MRDERVAAWARDEQIDPDVLRLLERVHHVASHAHLDAPGIDPTDPRQAGWGVVVHVAEPATVREALAPLLAHRREHTGAPVKVLDYHDGEDWREWLARHGVGADEVRPEKVPYYLLLVGPPTRIPFELQSLLAANYAVGRLSFEDPGDYRRHAESVIEAERRPAAPQGREVVFFAPRHPSDPLTGITTGLVVRPLVEGIAGAPGVAAERSYTVAGLLGDEATRDRLLAILAERPPALVLGAGHGVVWPPGHREQRAHQGDLVCQGWTGPGALAASHRLGAADLTDEARVHGTIAMLLTSYSAGTLAPEPFVARLPQRLLSHPRGGALAVIGRLDAAWGAAAAAQASVPLRAALGRLLEGAPVGHAVRELNQRHAALTLDLDALVRKESLGARVPDHEIATAWVERHQVRGVVVLGDPAARLRVDALPERL